MGVSISDVKKYLKERDHKEKLQRQHLFELATSEFDKMVEHIITNYNNITVYQWGSLMNPEDFDENSDIDIAVEGIKSAEVFFKLYGELMKMTNFPLDFVELERIDEQKQAIKLLKKNNPELANLEYLDKQKLKSYIKKLK